MSRVLRTMDFFLRRLDHLNTVNAVTAMAAHPQKSGRFKTLC
jgi:hypothetical protein